MNRRRILSSIALAYACSPAALPAAAADRQPAATLEALRREIVEIRRESAERYAALQRETDRRIALLEGRIEALGAQAARGDAAVAASGAELPSAPRGRELSALSFSGDFRLRYEHTAAHAGVRSRDRGTLQGRLGAEYRVGESVSLGTRLATGDPGDPNSANVSMSRFFDDLTVSLDRLYVAYRRDGLFATAGKFANPFTRTDLVWDGDVNPFGVAGRYSLYRSDTVNASITGIYSAVDEQRLRRDSDMLGGQISLRLQAPADWSISVDAAYYDYALRSLASAGPGDIRDNNLTVDGTAYLSDFDLLNLTAAVEYGGLAASWPLRIAGDYVRNLGAAVPEDTGYAVDFYAGDLGRVGGLQLRYGYARAQTDAVLAAFSHDNTTYATNYRQHTLGISYRPGLATYLNLTAYSYRRDDFALAAQPGDNDFVQRLRLNLRYRFE